MYMCMSVFGCMGGECTCVHVCECVCDIWVYVYVLYMHMCGCLEGQKTSDHLEQICRC